MSLSKPITDHILELLGNYFQQLYVNPVRTKSLTSCVIASLGNLTSQVIAGSYINHDSVIAFAIFGLLFGGSVPHYFYSFLEKWIPGSKGGASLMKFVIERFIYAPLYQFFSLYMLGILEGKDHEIAQKEAMKMYWPVLQANWRCLTIFQFINISMIPPVFRVLFINLIGFFWSIYLANKKRQTDEKNTRNDDRSL